MPCLACRSPYCALLTLTPSPSLSSFPHHRLGLDVPLFTRLLGSGVSSLLLDVQYRMHPAIAEWPSLHFYGGAVRSGVGAAERPPVAGVPWSSPDCPVLFINVEGEERRAGGGGGGDRRGAGGRSRDSDSEGGGGGGGASYSNPAEAEVAMKALVRVLQQDTTLSSVALLSPYR